MSESRRVLGEHKVVESIQSIADWVTKAKKVMSDIKSNKVDYNFYEITSDLEEDIARTDSDIEKDVLTGLLHSLNNAYSKIADKDDKEDIREDKELLVEDDIKVGDKIKIVYYNNHPDEDLLAWADEQNTDIFEVSEVDNDSKVFYIKDCEYGIPFDSDDYVTVNKKVTENEEDIPKLKVGDKVKIYSADDDELNYWLDDQNTDIFEVEDIDMENGCFWVKGCDYSVDMMTDDWKLVKESITEDVEEDLGEDFYEKICRAYIDTMNLEWVTTNPENYDSVVHGYFANDDVAEKWEYGAKVTPENFKDIAYEGHTEEEIENGEVDWYEYETWEDFYEDIVKSNIDYDIDDIGVYDFNDNWDFYISEEDLTKLGLWNEDMKSEFLDESKKDDRFQANLALHSKFGIDKSSKLIQELDIALEQNDKQKIRRLITKLKKELSSNDYNSFVKTYYPEYKDILSESKKVESLETKQSIYDELSKVLTDYEGNGDKDLKDDPKPLYDMLVKIQNNWEDTITSNLDESKKIVEDYDGNVFDKVLSIEDNSGDTLMQFKIASDGSLYGFDHCEIADEDNGTIRLQQVETFEYDLDESKKVTENISFDNIMDYRELIDGDNGDLVDTFFFDHKLTDEEDKAIIEAVDKAKSEVEDYDNYTVMECINKIVPIKQSLSAIYSDLGPSSKKQIKY